MRLPENRRMGAAFDHPVYGGIRMADATILRIVSPFSDPDSVRVTVLFINFSPVFKIG